MAGIVGMFTLLTMFAITRLPVPEPAKASERYFIDAWQDAELPPAKKADRFVSTESTAPHPVVVERIRPDAPASAPPVVLVQETDKPPAARRGRRVVMDVCARHHMHKVVTRGGKSWRCRK